LRASGFSLDEMRLYLQQRKRGEEAAAEQKALFLAHAEEVAEEIRQLQIRQRYLSGKVAYWDARLGGDLERAAQIAEENQEIAKELRITHSRWSLCGRLSRSAPGWSTGTVVTIDGGLGLLIITLLKHFPFKSVLTHPKRIILSTAPH
jgi:DNA-binding transcriptional MerR regulator